jgi:hypothetical protein
VTLPPSLAPGLAVFMPPPERRPCPQPYRLRSCERPAAPSQPAPEVPRPRVSPRQAKMLLAALLGMVAAAGVDLEPPPRRGR